MVFRICEKDEQILYRWDIVQLRILEQKDAGFQTAFDMTYFDPIGRGHHLGTVKIGRIGLDHGQISTFLPKEFVTLPENFFSLGQDETYYEHIKQLDTCFGEEIRHTLLRSLRDAAYDTAILESHLNEAVMDQSLLRNVVTDDDENHQKAIAKIKGQFNRMAEKGGARLTQYHFTYTAPKPKSPTIPPVKLEFLVDPDSNPPTNVHAMIGRNGCGKTHLIHHMVQCLQDRNGPYGEFNFLGDSGNAQKFANVVCIAFSPFDSFPEAVKEKRDLPATFVGLNEDILIHNYMRVSKPDQQNEEDSSPDQGSSSQAAEHTPINNRLIDAITEQFWKYLRNCLITGQRQQLWEESIRTLETGFNEYERGIFQEIDRLIKLMDKQFDEDKFQQNKQNIMDYYKPLSSGHKVVLLTIASCVAEIEERSILFLDEPENHLHPPLLSSLIRALSDLLRKRNGVAIVSTHSPIVLQEVPKSCVWLLTRYGPENIKPERLKKETFGSSLGTLIDDAFAFEVDQSGFHKLMMEAAQQYGSFEEVLNAYRGQLGNEASILLRMLMYEKEWE